MSIDPFIEAAADEAEKLWTLKMTPGHPLSDPERRHRRIGFAIGAQWARDHLAGQEPTEEEIEAAAQAIHDRWEGAPTWGLRTEDARAIYREDARSALSAARAVRREETR